MLTVTNRKHRQPVTTKIADVNIIAHSARGGFFIDPELCASIFSDIVADAGARSIIVDCMGINTVESFEDFLNRESAVFFFAVIGHKVVSMVWVDYTGVRSGNIHFVVFRRAYGGLNFIAGLATLGYIFDAGLFDSLMGFTPIDNTLALRINKRLGFVELGIAPLSHYDDVKKVSKDAMVTYCTKDRISEVIREHERSHESHEQNKD
jgi:hypothetical protein